ncbi:threonylcarbamoyl-AMP synthase [Suttonella sp. R2A3]|uniref:L-threonylcarbamoyladenylate synthase n=1 Tax=Suttonella sp. R2A3 TaxID=2908648 RepID=UPI001F40A03C|nr:L-threonylcarbamoyladenylate synthase [Suttonella sp. R2A3]UJF24781.1 threonylcarbamoyl-AMP synthase [Suttonella sp. R2A3]
MTQWIDMHPERINPRHISQVADVIREGGVAILPTDSGYSLICGLDEKKAAERIRLARDLSHEHPFTLLCSDLSHLAHYAKVDNVQFRLLKTLFPGAFTCVLPASREVPRRVQNDKRKTIGLRVPDYAVILAVINAGDEALMSVSLFDEDHPRVSVYDLPDNIVNQVDIIIDVGELANHPSTVLDLTEMPPQIIRQGAGDASALIK